MSEDIWINKDHLVDAEEHQRLKTMYRELKKEKVILKESLLREQSINSELIRKCESNMTAALELHRKDRKYIEELERELRNCTQEISFLQDQLSSKSATVNCIGELKVALDVNNREDDILNKNLKHSEDDLIQSYSRCLSLMRELDHNEIELENAASQIQKLESALSSIQLESQYEIESMKIDITSLEYKLHEAEKFCEQVAQEKADSDAFFNIQLDEAARKITVLEKDRKQMQEKFVEGIEALFSKMEEHLDARLLDKHELHHPSRYDFASLIYMKDVAFLNELCNSENVLSSFLSKLAIVTSWDDNIKKEIEKLRNQIRDLECVVSELKEELRGEKLKAKEDAEDLTQEMAELRYQITEMLEEEHKHRALIERASLQRIHELESEVQREKMKCSKATKHIQQANELAKARAVEIRHLKSAFETTGNTSARKKSEAPRYADSCCCKDCLMSRSSPDCYGDHSCEDESFSTEFSNSDSNPFGQASIEWYLDEHSVAKQMECIHLKYSTLEKESQYHI